MVERRSDQGPASKLTRQQKGRLGEEAACDWLREHHYRILCQNWRCRSGEIDIVAAHEGMIIFVEVRSRSGTGRYGTPQESVDIRKIQQVRATASVYLQMTGETNHQIRFDVIAVMLDKAGETVSLDHIINAF
ncbi:MAG TPA: YraN family protein [Paenibacillus sp.]|uniref:YraN family protein n=1 Tax=Paenibacillus TaxID=44249 RepID=UPI000BA0EB13|nr:MULTISPECIES: YraN family protein [Paenibacillus]OZQ73656.1 YraN family protein [Paenibacillus taichungensis]HBU85026.1 YraN family protein [Paenibacillus sp.]